VAQGRIYLREPDVLVLDSPYDPKEVAATKKIPGARWNKIGKVWEFPTTSLSPLMQLAVDFGHTVDPLLSGVKPPEHPVGENRIEVGDKLHVYFTYDQVKVSAIRKIPGARFDKKNLKWDVPLAALPFVLDFANTFSFNLENADELLALKEAQEQEAAFMEALSKAEDGTIEVDGLRGELFPYQKAGVEYAVKAKKTFIADEVGLGKTIQAIATLEETGAYPAVVTAPPSLLLNWQKEINAFAPHRSVAIVQDRQNFPEGEFDYLIIGDSNIATWKKQLKGYQGYVFDESQRFKRYEAKRTKAAIDMAKKGEVVLLLTGTPITNRPAEFASQLQIIGRLDDFGGKWAFYKRYAKAYKDRFGKWDISGASNLPELNQRLRSTCYVRRLKKQVLKDLPEIRKHRMYVALGDTAMAEYDKAEQDIIEYMAQRAAQIARELGESPNSAAVRARFRASAAEELVKLAALRRLAALGKLPAIHEWIEERVNEGLKVVVGAHHRDVVDAIAEKWGKVKIQGGMRKEDVEENKHIFQEGDAPVMVISIQAGGTGHTLTAAQDVLIAEHPWTPAERTQLIGRLHRIGQTNSILAVDMIASKTIDEQIVDLLDKKEAIVEAATEGKNVQSTSIASELLFDFLDNALPTS